MQVNHGSFDIDKNVQQGVTLLREYFLLMKKDIKATVLSYNIGPYNVMKGKFVIDYWYKYVEAKHVYSAWLVQESKNQVPVVNFPVDAGDGIGSGSLNAPIVVNPGGVFLSLDWESSEDRNPGGIDTGDIRHHSANEVRESLD
jgi:hypothetical protein